MAHLNAPFRMRAPIKTIGQRVRDHRLARDMSQADLGRKAHVSPNFIGEFERGNANCSLVTLLHLAEGLGCTLTQLIAAEPVANYVMLSADDQRRAHEALAVLGSVLTTRKRAPESNEWTSVSG